MQMIEYADREALIEKITDHLARDLTSALQNWPRATFVVPGGTTPGPIFDLLCRKNLDWAQVDVMLSDERCCPRMIRVQTPGCCASGCWSTALLLRVICRFMPPVSSPSKGCLRWLTG